MKRDSWRTTQTLARTRIWIIANLPEETFERLIRQSDVRIKEAGENCAQV